jgi:hypothetical protein
VSPLGFGPLQRLPDGGQPPVPGNPSPQLVASSGFRDLLTPCSAHHLPALFHAGPAPGVHPSEHCSSPRSRTPSPAPRPSCRCCRDVHTLFAEPARGSIVDRATFLGTSPSGVRCHAGVRYQTRWFRPRRPVALLGFASSGCSPSSPCRGLHRDSPLAVAIGARRRSPMCRSRVFQHDEVGWSASRLPTLLRFTTF